MRRRNINIVYPKDNEIIEELRDELHDAREYNRRSRLFEDNRRLRQFEERYIILWNALTAYLSDRNDRILIDAMERDFAIGKTNKLDNGRRGKH